MFNRVQLSLQVGATEPKDQDATDGDRGLPRLPVVHGKQLRGLFGGRHRVPGHQHKDTTVAGSHQRRSVRVRADFMSRAGRERWKEENK